ncbi:hypothetical protein CLF_113555 [Clonorchis sinensis]|uniref:Uncharacterized protein n=1 Tax=Clonorchis sinensis TaxID=79923 RepID=G7YMU8_CLOSI|nr:hypothetical protein CLF_113555 [Clonorchis sinensis]
MQARTVWVTPDVIVDKKLAPPTGVPAKRLKHCDAENLGGISGQLDSDKFRVALSSGLFFSCGLTGVFENINIGGRVIHLNPSSVNLEDVHCGQPTSDFFGLKFAGNFPSLEDRSSTIWSWASNTHSSYRRFCTMFRRLPDNHRQKVTVTQRAHRGLVRVENPCEEVNKTRRGFVNQKHTRTSIFELLIGSFSAGGLVQHIQLPENITNRRFNWVPEQSLKDIEYADDTAPLESDADVMQIKLNNLNNSASRFGTRFTPEKANREPCPECPARRILVHRLRSTYEMHTFDRLACQKSEVQMPAYVADDVVLFINWYSYPTLAVVPSGKLISTRNWILEMNKQVDSQFLLGCEERIPRITTTSKEGVDYDKYTNLRIHLVLLDSPGTQLSSAFITYIHVSRYLKYRSKWNMRRPGTAHSVDWKHHKREIQLGSR